jgi:hypothetical protein
MKSPFAGPHQLTSKLAEFLGKATAVQLVVKTANTQGERLIRNMKTILAVDAGTIKKWLGLEPPFQQATIN